MQRVDCVCVLVRRHHNVIVCPSLQRVHFRIEVGDDAEDYKEVAEREKLTQLQTEIRKLLDKANKVKKEQDYQRVSLPRVTYTHVLTTITSLTSC